MTLDQEAPRARGHMVVDRAISGRAGPIVEIARPANQHAVDVLANFLPRVFIAPAQDCADQLMRSVARRIVDKHILRLIKMWLKTPVEETGKDGGKRLTGGKRSKLGTPQGGVMTPLTQKVTSPSIG